MPRGYKEESLHPVQHDSSPKPTPISRKRSSSDVMKNRRASRACEVALDANLLSPAALRDETVMETAIGNLEATILNFSVDLSHILNKLVAIDNLFEFALSAMSHETSVTFVYSIISQFPTTPESFVTSLSSKLLFRLSRYFWMLNYPASGLSDSHRSVEMTYACLQAVPELSLGDAPDTPTKDDEDAEPFSRKKSQKEKKRARRASRPIPSVDSRHFDNLGVPVPKTKADAEGLTKTLLDDQMRILQYYFQTLRKPELADKFKTAYIPDTVVDANNSDASTQHPDSSAPSDAATQELPPAYPIVQPMKAALYFDTAEGFGDWRVYISTRADGNLREAKKKDPTLFKIIIKKIKELSKGHFSDDNQKRLNGPDVDIPVFEAKMTRDSRLVYQIDCVKEFDSDIEWQVLRIFGIYTHAQLDKRFWDAVGHQLGGKGKEYKKRCVFRNAPHHHGDSVVGPASFPPMNEPVAAPVTIKIPDLRNEDREELHSLLVLEKFVTFSQALLNSILADQDVAHVFQMSPQEQQIVQHGSSCYVLGRSGTGKTTTMIFKMLGIERTWEQTKEVFENAVSRPRQLFVTQSKVLAEKVEEYYAKLSQSLAAEQRSTQESTKLSTDKEQKGLVDRDEEDLHRGELPKRFGELEDKHFPLFLTYDQLCRLLEGELGVKLGFMPNDNADPTSSPTATPVSNDYMLQKRASFVSYLEFLRTYWPHFPQNLTKKLDPALVFAEFMGVVKGSERTLQSESGYLTKEEYEALSVRSHGTFSNQRDAIYSLFVTYQRMRAERRHYDAADRTHAIVKNLLGVGIPGRPVDFIYVDEVQDNLLIDAHILRSICSNPNGLFWAGDTAQTISAGSSFRFNDLKAFLYRLEEVRQGGEPPKPPETFQLITNYRSHNGIVGCAHSVVALITEFWPHAIDTLAEEKGIVDGLKPVFFSGWDKDTVRYEQFLFGESGSQIEFGAKQCILVRDDVAREKLRKQVGDIGLILTLYESKGLEFDDVLLYNFFEDSTVDLSQWRVVLNALPTKEINCPRFDDNRHSGVCRELKFLYVAITRARKNLWIADCSERGEPMRAVWDSKDRVQNCSPGDNVPQLTTVSSPEEWAQTARTLFDNRRYLQAVHSYERAGLLREKDVAYAYYFREQARAMPATSRPGDNPRNVAFIDAAEAFLASAEVAESRQERLAYYRIAAECFTEGDENGRAAAAYLSATEYTRSAQHYRKAGMFDEAVNVVQTHRKDIPAPAAEKIIDVAKLHYFTKNKVDQATRLFDSLEDAMEYMEEYEFDVARADLFERSGRLTEAAELHISEGRVVKAISLLLKDAGDDSLSRAQSCLLDGLWKALPFGVTVRFREQCGQPAAFLNDLILQSDEFLKTPGISTHVQDQLHMFKAIFERNLPSLRKLALRFNSEHQDPTSALLCLDHLFSLPFKLQNASVFEVSTILEAFILYTRLLVKLAIHWNPAQEATVQRLFGFRMHSASTFIIHHGTRLKETIMKNPRALATDDPSGLIIRNTDLNFTLKTWMVLHLRTRAELENTESHNAPAFLPCVIHAVLGECYSRDCRHVHISSDAVDAEWFSCHIRIIFQQIIIYHTLMGFQKREIYLGQQKYWLEVLYHALYPPSSRLGSLMLLDRSKIPEGGRAVPIIRDWLRNLFYSFDPRARNQSRMFVSHMTDLVQLAFYFDREDAQAYISRIPCVANAPPPWLLRNQDKSSYVINDLIELVKSDSEHAISTGVLFLKHICSGASVVNISSLARLVEMICGAGAIALHMERSSLHDLSLPLNWLRELSLAHRNTQMIFLFVESIATLLVNIYTGADHLLFYQGRNLAIAKPPVRSIFIARICRAICFLGYNFRNLSFRISICKAIGQMRKVDNHAHPLLYSRFTNARHWDDMVKALRWLERTYASRVDEWIHLKEEKFIKPPLKPTRGVRIVVYKDISDIPILLSGGTPAHRLRADAEAFVPRALPASTADEAEEDGPEDEVIRDNEDDVGVAQAEDLQAAELSIDAERVEQAVIPPTEQEIEAARLIQLFYRKTLRHRKVRATAASEARTRWFKGYLRAVKQYPGVLNKPYERLFLGPLPHALVCLEKMSLNTDSAKKKALIRLRTTQHRDIEDAQEQFDKARRTLKELTRLQNLLGPNLSSKATTVHALQDVRQLRKCILEVEAMVQTFGIEDWDLQIAIKGIVKERVQKKEKKPQLVLDDDFELELEFA
ncbi:hypothetical protein EIP91_006977 [Steccherinum ochraceum]|uniref:UvrD-like helicase ATP-binding domain-containing protein n=1 Tax=Steccherinum ochraceum TaxID=92696 RepID=A0A4R0RFE7_9APHY|nr:hypothetical protein EIP91_006977 [Steccherinum ochraceum]